MVTLMMVLVGMAGVVLLALLISLTKEKFKRINGPSEVDFKIEMNRVIADSTVMIRTPISAVKRKPAKKKPVKKVSKKKASKKSRK